MKFIRKSLIIASSFLMACMMTACSGGDSKKEAAKEDDTTKEPKTAMVANDTYVEPVNPTEAQIKAYNQLSAALENQDLEEEAKQVAVSFVYDFFTLSNKKSQDDMGGLAFIPTAYIGTFQEYATSYYYGNYPTIINEYGKDSLPQVTDVRVTSIEAAPNLMYHYQPVEGYLVTLQATYADSKLSADQLKTSMTVTVIRMYDYDYDTEIDYTSNYTQTGDPIEVYRVYAIA